MLDNQDIFYYWFQSQLQNMTISHDNGNREYYEMTEKKKEKKFRYQAGDIIKVNFKKDGNWFEIGDVFRVISRHNAYPDCEHWTGCWLPIYYVENVKTGIKGEIGQGFTRKIGGKHAG